MWDLLIITAGTIGQKEDFELFLQQMDLASFTNSWAVMSDDPSESRIGSGGCMFSIISRLKAQYEQDLLSKKILLIHSGGLSQRMPHLSCYGKVFAYLPGGKTILELKLKSYKKFPSILEPGLLVAASDVLEDTTNFREVKDSDMILFANQSSLKTACQHGVFVLDNDGKLQSVLQKPTEAQIIAHNALRPDGSVLTDCFYWMSWRICEKLGDLYSPTLREEICCYGDFMRPLGSKPCLSYLSEGTMELQLYRQRLSSIFAGTKEELIDLGPQSFYHLGTIEEFLQHIDENSIFSKKFSIEHDGKVYSDIKNCKIEKGCYVEYSDISNIQISSNCIVSSIRSSGGMVIPENSVVFTICTKRGYVTILFHTHDDIKKKEEHLMWMEKNTGLTQCSLWNAAIFPIRETRQSSLEATLSMVSTFTFEPPNQRLKLEAQPNSAPLTLD